MFNRFDICEAYYMFATLYHGGMGSEEYQIFNRLSKIKFKPSPMLDVESLSENAREIFDALIEAKGYEPFDGFEEDPRAGHDTFERQMMAKYPIKNESSHLSGSDIFSVKYKK